MRRDPAPRRQAGQGAARDVAPCIDSSFGKLQGQSLQDLNHGHGHLVTEAFGGNNTAGPIEVATALNAHGGPRGRSDFESETFVAHALRGEGFDASEDGTGRGTPIVPIAFDTTQITSVANLSQPKAGDPCHPLAAGAHAPSIAWSIMPQNSGKDFKARQVDVAQPLMAGGPVGGNQGGDYIQQRLAVRRLTPIECERLQGFPDRFTDVPWRGRGHAPDGPRYKALGNSMAVNVMRWIGSRIQMVEDVCKTLEMRGKE